MSAKRETRERDNNNNHLFPRAFPLKKWVGREKALASAGHVSLLNIHMIGNV